MHYQNKELWWGCISQKMAPTWEEQVQRQSQFCNTNGVSLAHAHWHLTFGSSCRLWPECNAHFYFYWTIGSSSKSLDMMRLISEKETSEMKVFYDRGWFVGNELYNSALFLGKQLHLGVADLYHTGQGGICYGICWHRMGSCICFSCHIATNIIFFQHFIKSFYLGQVLSKSNIWFISKENKF